MLNFRLSEINCIVHVDWSIIEKIGKATKSRKTNPNIC